MAEQLLPTKHLNHRLFSDHYLDEIVPTTPEWKTDNELYQAVKLIRDDLKQRLEDLAPETLDEAQLEERWVKPVLVALGHHWSVQVKIRALGIN